MTIKLFFFQLPHSAAALMVITDVNVSAAVETHTLLKLKRADIQTNLMSDGIQVLLIYPQLVYFPRVSFMYINSSRDVK